MSRPNLRQDFPFRQVFRQFLTEFSTCTTYWYVPKARTLSPRTIHDLAAFLAILDESFSESTYDTATQDEILRQVVDAGIIERRVKAATQQDRTAAVRIWIALSEFLGLAWIKDEQDIVVTNAGYDLLTSANPFEVIERQISKIQYPNPTMAPGNARGFKGLLPHFFLLQLLHQCKYKLDRDEVILFVNLAQSHDDLDRIATYIDSWRDLQKGEQQELLEIAHGIPMATKGGGKSVAKRHNRIQLNFSYQVAAHCIVPYLDKRGDEIVATEEEHINFVATELAATIAIPRIETKEKWLVYFGDPDQRPSWFSYLANELAKAKNSGEVLALIEENQSKLSSNETQDIKRRQVEKDIEDFYFERPYMIEEGLQVVKNGRQHGVPIGEIDLLCRDANGQYVVVEIKAGDARDSAFGQVLRYMGWIHRNFDDGRHNVRGILLARGFPEKAKYSRIGLLRDDHRDFIKFVKYPAVDII